MRHWILSDSALYSNLGEKTDTEGKKNAGRTQKAVPVHPKATKFLKAVVLLAGALASSIPPISSGTGLQEADMLQIIISLTITILCFSAYFIIRHMEKTGKIR